MIPHSRLLKSRRALSLCVCLLALLIGSTALVRRAFVFSPAGQTFTVTNTNDNGAGSLRQAILDVNNMNSGARATLSQSINQRKHQWRQSDRITLRAVRGDHAQPGFSPSQGKT